MAEPPNDIQARFLDRIERRVQTLKTLADAGLGVYLPPDEEQRKRAMERVVRMTARQSELPHLSADTLNSALATVRTHLESMQKVLPHDVQYRNRIRREW